MTRTQADPELRPVTLITGATRGIGREIARLAAADGHCLWLLARDARALEALADELGRQSANTIHVHATDLTAPQAVDALAARLTSEGYYVRYLINCAGMGLSGPFARHGRDELMRMIDLNMRALTELSHRFLPEMIARRAGGILNVASLGGFVPGPSQAAYYASKAYVISLSRALAYETRRRKVRVAVLIPGAVDTDFHEKMGAHKSYYLKLLPTASPAQVARQGYHGFMCGQRLIVPGLINPLLALFISFMPGLVTIPMMAWLLRRRR